MSRMISWINGIKKWQCFLICFLILFIGLYTNLASRICYDGVADFDWWSNDIMISDMMYVENFGNDRLFLYSVTPPMVCEDNAFAAKGIQPEMFKKNKFFEQDFYRQYTSNIVIQRYFYRFLLRYLPVSHANLLNILYIFNCILAAGIIALVFMWIHPYTDSIVCMNGAFILAFLCPYFAMYGKNLYWCMWSLFFPMACMGMVVNSNVFKQTLEMKQEFIMGIVAFISCFVKMSVCFEFMTSVMIAMTIPIFYYCIVNKDRMINIIKMIIGPFIGAIAAFLMTFVIKMWMLFYQYGREEGIKLIWDNLGQRLLGTGEDGAMSVEPIRVIVIMLEKEFISFRGVGKITFMFLIMAYLFVFVAYFYINTSLQLFDF